MHELGVVIEVVNTVESFAKENNITVVKTLVLQIGEISSMIPRYVEECFPAAVDGTLLENTELVVEVLPANVICRNCNKVFRALDIEKQCPECESKDLELLGGKEFLIKEIVGA